MHIDGNIVGVSLLFSGVPSHDQTNPRNRFAFREVVILSAEPAEGCPSVGTQDITRYVLFGGWRGSRSGG